VTVKRLLAFLGAVALIVGAVFARNALDDKSSDATSTTDKPSGGKTTVICSPELEAVCKQLDSKAYTITIESAGDTLDRLTKNGAQPPDAWVTLDPFPGMIDVLRGVATLTPLAPSITAVANDEPTLAVAKSPSGSFAVACPSPPVWKCIGSNAGKDWATLDSAASIGGKLLPGLADPSGEAIGLVTFANAVGGYFNSATYTSSDWLGNLDFNGWLRNFKNFDNVSSGGQSALSTLLVLPTRVNVAATTGVELKANPQPKAVVAVPVTPSLPIIAVVATFGSKASGLVRLIGPLLVLAGWNDSRDPSPKLSPGTFIALRKLWEGK
jgi:hypothetical protein